MLLKKREREREERQMLFFLSFSVLKKITHLSVMWLKSFNEVSLLWAEILSPHIVLIINSD